MDDEETFAARLLAQLKALSPARRLALMGAAVLSLLIFALGSAPEPGDEARLIERPSAARSPARHVDVPRAKLAGEELRDPFSPLRERRGEAKADGPSGAAREKTAQAKKPAASPAPQPAGKAREASAVPHLTGVIMGGEPLAALELGGQSAALKTGEKLGAYRVESIEAGGVLLSSPAGELWLSVPR